MCAFLTPIILGIVEGVTEFLPVSSTGHLLLFEHWLPRQSDLFNVVIQSGAVLAVLFVFAKRILHLLQTWRTAETQRFVGKLALAFLTTAIGGLLLQKLHFTLPETILPVALATFLGGIVILWIEALIKGKRTVLEISWSVAALLGLAQIAAAVFPGLSRSGATILLAIFLGVRRTEAAEFSFLLGVPTLLAAAALKIFGAWQEQSAVDWSALLLGTIAAAVTAFLVVRFLMHFLTTHTFRIFGWYRIFLGILLFLLLLWQ